MTFTGNVPPEEHLKDAVKLQADGIVDLFEFNLISGGVFRLKDNETVYWGTHWEQQNGVPVKVANKWQGLPIQLSGFSMGSNDQVYRPTLSIANPSLEAGNREGVFSRYILDNLLEGATVYRYRVLYSDLMSNKVRYLRQIWRVCRIISLTKQSVSMELRTLSDNVNAVIPARRFVPPEFPLVTLE